MKMVQVFLHDDRTIKKIYLKKFLGEKLLTWQPSARLPYGKYFFISLKQQILADQRDKCFENFVCADIFKAFKVFTLW